MGTWTIHNRATNKGEGGGRGGRGVGSVARPDWSRGQAELLSSLPSTAKPSGWHTEGTREMCGK